MCIKQCSNNEEGLLAPVKKNFDETLYGSILAKDKENAVRTL